MTTRTIEIGTDFSQACLNKMGQMKEVGYGSHIALTIHRYEESENIEAFLSLIMENLEYNGLECEFLGAFRQPNSFVRLDIAMESEDHCRAASTIIGRLLETKSMGYFLQTVTMQGNERDPSGDLIYACDRSLKLRG